MGRGVLVARVFGRSGLPPYLCCRGRIFAALDPFEEQFQHPDGYYPDMKARALADLNEIVAAHARNLEPLLV